MSREGYVLRPRESPVVEVENAGLILQLRRMFSASFSLLLSLASSSIVSIPLSLRAFCIPINKVWQTMEVWRTDRQAALVIFEEGLAFIGC